MLVTAPQVRELSVRLERRSPLEILRLCHQSLGPRAAILCSMQWAGLLLAHMADRDGLRFDVLFVDTGVLHEQTLRARDELAATHPNLNVLTLTPELTFAQQTERRGLLYVSKEGQQECCELRKSAPLATQRGKYDVLLSTLRREEGGKRSKVGVVELDRELALLRVHPFALSTRDALVGYASEHPDVVENSLHAMGFPSVGCFPCTSPVRPDEDERAGRWRHLADVAYCGINPTDREAADEGVLLGGPADGPASQAVQAFFAAI